MYYPHFDHHTKGAESFVLQECIETITDSHNCFPAAIMAAPAPPPVDGVGNEDQYFLCVNNDSYGVRRKSSEPGGPAGIFIQKTNCALDIKYVVTDPDIALQRLGFNLLIQGSPRSPQKVCLVLSDSEMFHYVLLLIRLFPM